LLGAGEVLEQSVLSVLSPLDQTSHFAELLEPLDLAGAVVTFDALCRYLIGIITISGTSTWKQ
jgi:hypothetical protein